MENRIAIIKNGLVKNVIVCSDLFAQNIQDTTVNVTNIDCEIGYSYDGTNFSAPTLTTEELEAVARQWRDSELSSTDNVSQTPDYPNRDVILVYRQELRDWPTTDAFPDTKPLAPAEL